MLKNYSNYYLKHRARSRAENTAIVITIGLEETVTANSLLTENGASARMNVCIQKDARRLMSSTPLSARENRV